MFLLFLNTRPRFRVKEHSGSGALYPLLVTHMNQDLPSRTALILDVGFPGCQDSKESWAKQPFHPDLPSRVPFAKPGGPEQTEAARRERAVPSRLFPRGGSAPWAGDAPFPRWAPKGEQLFPQGAGAGGARRFPHVPLPGHLCAAHTHRGAGSSTRAPPPPTLPGRKGLGAGSLSQPASRGLARLPSPSRLPHRHLRRSLGAPGKEKPAGRPGAHTPRG